MATTAKSMKNRQGGRRGTLFHMPASRLRAAVAAPPNSRTKGNTQGCRKKNVTTTLRRNRTVVLVSTTTFRPIRTAA